MAAFCSAEVVLEDTGGGGPDGEPVGSPAVEIVSICTADMRIGTKPTDVVRGGVQGHIESR